MGGVTEQHHAGNVIGTSLLLQAMVTLHQLKLCKLKQFKLQLVTQLSRPSQTKIFETCTSGEEWQG